MNTAKVTMAEVARRAGVSPTTVARVLYSDGYVIAEKREAVLKAVEETGYRPNVLARGLRVSRSFIIGMILTGGSRNPYFAKVADSVQTSALEEGYTVLAANNRYSPDAERAAVERFLDHQVDAVVFCEACDPQNVHLVLDRGVPVVQIERQIAAVGHLVRTDSAAGMLAALQHLTGLGHERIAYIGAGAENLQGEGRKEDSAESLRAAAFAAAARQVGLALPAERVILCDGYLDASGAPEPGANAMRQLLHQRDVPTAVVTGSDLLAAGVLQAIHQMGGNVPRDFSVIGFGNSLAPWMTPALTTITQPMAEIGRAALQLATDGSAPSSDREICLPTSLVVRASTGIASIQDLST